MGLRDIENRVSAGEVNDLKVMIGIPDDQMPILFETFAQIDIPQNRTLRGAGLGLPISRDLVRLHGGTITVESAYGEGSKFIVSLPRHPVLEVYTSNA